MKLQALDQIHVSAVKPDSLRPGEEFEIDDARGAALLAQHPKLFRAIEPEPSAPAEAESPATTPEAAKADPAPANKADGRRRTKAR